jgi:glyoxylase-like metal-dependent hydrolase (beta-lactamase superfamily II)
MKITHNVYMLECSKIAHVYLIKGEETLIIDTGLPGLSKKILKEINTFGVSDKSLKNILITHHDIDHIGSAKKLQDITGAKLWASKEDAPYIVGDINREGIKRLVQLVLGDNIPVVNETYTSNRNFKDVKVIKAPGHTPGHVIFLYNKILFSGDLFRVKKNKIELVSPSMTWNMEELNKSLKMLKNIEVDWICPSHGYPIRNNKLWKEFINKY